MNTARSLAGRHGHEVNAAITRLQAQANTTLGPAQIQGAK
jgi:hypothetical protein